MQETLNDLFKKIDTNQLLLPDFQRQYKWDLSKQQSLLASVILNFPVGSSLILQGNSKEFASRKIGENQQSIISSNYQCMFLLDGQQRTTTLYNAFNDVYETKKIVDRNQNDGEKINQDLSDFIASKSSSMKVRWFLRFSKNPSEAMETGLDPFNIKLLDFKKESLDQSEPSEIYDIFVGYKFSENNKQKTKPFSPYFEVTAIDFNDVEKSYRLKSRRLEEFCVEENLFPLYLLSNDARATFLKEILKQIALKRAKALRDEMYDNYDFIKSLDNKGLLDDFESFEQARVSGRYDDIIKAIFDNCAFHWSDSVYNYLKKDVLEKYIIPGIVTSDIRRAIPIFCHINEGGMELDDFDLLAARAARFLPSDNGSYSLAETVKKVFAQQLKLPESITAGLQQDVHSFNVLSLDNIKDGLPSKFVKQSVLALCSMLAKAREKNFFNESSNRIKIDDSKSKTLLSLDTEQIRECIEDACLSVIRALIFLNLRCGVHNSSKLHYALMLQPIAFALSCDDVWQSKKALAKIEYWYWISYFCGDYLYDQKTVCTRDINFLFDFAVDRVDGKRLKDKIADIFNNQNFNSKHLLMGELEERPQAGIKLGMLQFVLSTSPYDFTIDMTQKIFSYKVEHGVASFIDDQSLNDHHIMPLNMIKKPGESATSDIRSGDSRFNSPLNRTFITRDSNLKLSDIGPERYFSYLGERAEHISHILESHFIPGDAIQMMLSSSSEENALFIMESRFNLILKAVRARLLQLET